MRQRWSYESKAQFVLQQPKFNKVHSRARNVMIWSFSLLLRILRLVRNDLLCNSCTDVTPLKIPQGHELSDQLCYCHYLQWLHSAWRVQSAFNKGFRISSSAWSSPTTLQRAFRILTVKEELLGTVRWVKPGSQINSPCETDAYKYKETGTECK